MGGYVCAVLSGIFFAGAVICVRMKRNICVWHFSLSVFACSAVAMFLTYQTGVIEDFSFQHLSESPTQALSWIILIGVLNPFSSVLLNLGAALCPAALSATVN